jgi:hypothetical protein
MAAASIGSGASTIPAAATVTVVVRNKACRSIGGSAVSPVRAAGERYASVPESTLVKALRVAGLASMASAARMGMLMGRPPLTSGSAGRSDRRQHTRAS